MMRGTRILSSTRTHQLSSSSSSGWNSTTAPRQFQFFFSSVSAAKKAPSPGGKTPSTSSSNSSSSSSRKRRSRGGGRRKRRGGGGGGGNAANQFKFLPEHTQSPKFLEAKMKPLSRFYEALLRDKSPEDYLNAEQHDPLKADIWERAGLPLPGTAISTEHTPATQHPTPWWHHFNKFASLVLEETRYAIQQGLERQGNGILVRFTKHQAVKNGDQHLISFRRSDEQDDMDDDYYGGGGGGGRGSRYESSSSSLSLSYEETEQQRTLLRMGTLVAAFPRDNSNESFTESSSPRSLIGINVSRPNFSREKREGPVNFDIKIYAGKSFFGDDDDENKKTKTKKSKSPPSLLFQGDYELIPVTSMLTFGRQWEACLEMNRTSEQLTTKFPKLFYSGATLDDDSSSSSSEDDEVDDDDDSSTSNDDYLKRQASTIIDWNELELDAWLQPWRHFQDSLHSTRHDDTTTPTISSKTIKTLVRALEKDDELKKILSPNTTQSIFNYLSSGKRSNRKVVKKVNKHVQNLMRNVEDVLLRRQEQEMEALLRQRRRDENQDDEYGTDGEYDNDQAADVVSLPVMRDDQQAITAWKSLLPRLQFTGPITVGPIYVQARKLIAAHSEEDQQQYQAYFDQVIASLDEFRMFPDGEDYSKRKSDCENAVRTIVRQLADRRNSTSNQDTSSSAPSPPPVSTRKFTSEEMQAAKKLFVVPNLNASQEKAANDFLQSTPGEIKLVQGPPGTGKTNLLTAVLLRFLLDDTADEARRIMIAAPTNKAITLLCSRFLDATSKCNGIVNTVLIGDEGNLMADGVRENKSLQRIYGPTWKTSLIEDFEKLNSIIFTGSNDRNSRGTTAESKSLDRKKVARLAKMLVKKLDSQLPSSDKHVGKAKADIVAQFESYGARRLVQTRTISSSIRKVTDYLEKLDNNDVLKELLSTAHVIFGTLASAGSAAVRATEPITSMIVDEAGAATEPDFFIPLAFLKPNRIMAVGDPNQLPATVTSQIASRHGLDKSLHERLMFDEQHPYTMLDVQYRMKPDISQFPSLAFYSGKIANGPNVGSEDHKSEVSLLCGRPYLFVETYGREEDKWGSKQNYEEARKVVDLLSEYRDSCGSDIGRASGDRIRVITFYQAQVNLIKRLLKNENNNFFEKIVVSSVDSSQGSEADVVILSFVRTGENTVGFLADTRRLNVALTRAKHQLICVGNSYGLSRCRDQRAQIVQSLIQDASQRGLLVEPQQRSWVGGGDYPRSQSRRRGRQTNREDEFYDSDSGQRQTKKMRKAKVHDAFDW